MRAIDQAELIPLAAANSRRGSGPGRGSELASSLHHRGLAAGAGEGGEAAVTPDRNGGGRPGARRRESLAADDLILWIQGQNRLYGLPSRIRRPATGPGVWSGVQNGISPVEWKL